VCAGGWNSTLPNAVDWDEFLASGSVVPIDWPRDIDETLAMGLCYTSGTTGNPKGVAFSQRSTYLHTMVGRTESCAARRGRYYFYYFMFYRLFIIVLTPSFLCIAVVERQFRM
jgi:acyl-CoA synthetase (AMP-forming)/AMP-acid ligase II